MKIKEINRTANVAWSPKQQYPIYLAAGTAAQQLDSTFSTSANLDIYHVNLESQEFDMPIAGSLPSQHRFHKLMWTECGMSTNQYKSGLILGGTDNGELCVLNADAILSGDTKKANVMTFKDHSGAIQALDVNKFQNNVVVSGGPDSEIYIWDLNNPGVPLKPGQKSTPPDQISCLAWNQQVQHILASSSPTGRVVVWDLRKTEPIIKVGDQSAMFQYKSLAWHPDIATQILIGNEDDRYPIIQMWDLRFASSPMKVMEGHTRGVLSLAWCPEDSDLLMSCGKDNKILCWDPNSQPQSGEIVYELPSTSQWTADVQWCPRNPGVVSTTAFDGHITVSTLMGGSQEIQQQQQQSQISDSFGIQHDAFTPPPQQTPSTLRIEPIRKPPKWMRVPCGARFGFGGKLISFGNINEPNIQKQVFVSQVVTDTELVGRSHELENSLLSGQLEDYCNMKISDITDEKEKTLWQFLKANFSNEPRMKFLDLLGYNPQELAQKISTLNSQQSSLHDSSSGVNPAELARKIENLKVGESVASDKLFGSGGVSPLTGQKTPGSESEGSALFDAIAASTSNPADTTEEIIQQDTKIIEPFSIPTSDDTDGLICQALLSGNFEAAVDVCFNDDRKADGLLLAIAGGPDLFTRTQRKYFSQSKKPISKVISAVVNRDWRNLIEFSEIINWKEALCILVTYGKAEEFSELCCVLGERLENEIGDFHAALICYICAGDVERLVSCWTRSDSGKESTPMTLQSLIEKVMILKKSVESTRDVATDNTHLAEQLCNYAQMLSSQGNLQTAMMYLSSVNNQGVAVLKDRVFRAHGQMQGYAPECPFQRIDVRSQQQPSNQNRMPPQTKPNKFVQDPGYSRGYEQPNQFSPHNTYNPNMPTPNYYTPGSQNVGSMSVPPSISDTTNRFNIQTPNMPPTGPVPFRPGVQPGNMFPPPTSTPSYMPAPMLTPQPQPPMNVGPPPPSNGNAPMSLRKAKQEPSHVAPTQSIDFYNPMANKASINPIGAPSAQPPTMPNIGAPNMNNRLPPGQPKPPSQIIKKEPEPIKQEVAKGPVPAEHAILQQTFDEIVERCRNSTNNPQTKRKLEDVRRRLEILYDLLRNNKVSPNVLNGLHQMVQVCQHNDYMNGIQIHTHMISTGNFSEISSFMPGLKTMMQIANQLKV